MTSRPAPASLLLLVLAFLLAGLVGHARLATDPLAVDARAQAVATIASDLPDYAPGETVTLTGSGWTPGETVTIVLHRQPLVQPDTVLTAVADGSGTITNTSFAPSLGDLGVTFFVTATGSQSGLQATTTFDARAKRSPGPAPSPRTGTPPATGTRLACPPPATTSRFRPASQRRYPVVSSTVFAKSIDAHGRDRPARQP